MCNALFLWGATVIHTLTLDPDKLQTKAYFDIIFVPSHLFQNLFGKTKLRHRLLDPLDRVQNRSIKSRVCIFRQRILDLPCMVPLLGGVLPGGQFEGKRHL